MSDDDLRRLLDFPDTHLHLPPVTAIAHRAHRRRTRQRLAVLGVAAAVVVLVALLGTFAQVGTQLTIPVSPAAPHLARLTVERGEHVHVTHGWSAWLTPAGAFCWGHGATATRTRSCRSADRVTHGRLQVLVLDTRGGGAVYLGLVPWRSSKVDLHVGRSTYRLEDLVGFADAPGRALYVTWLHERDPAATVTVYDACGHPHTVPPGPSSGGTVCPKPGPRRY